MEHDVLPGILKRSSGTLESEYGKSEVVSRAFAELQAKKALIKQQMSLR